MDKNNTEAAHPHHPVLLESYISLLLASTGLRPLRASHRRTHTRPKPTTTLPQQKNCSHSSRATRARRARRARRASGLRKWASMTASTSASVQGRHSCSAAAACPAAGPERVKSEALVRYSWVRASERRTAASPCHKGFCGHFVPSPAGRVCGSGHSQTLRPSTCRRFSSGPRSYLSSAGRSVVRLSAARLTCLPEGQQRRKERMASA